jgi:cell division protein FtsW (lipid II flippase)
MSKSESFWPLAIFWAVALAYIIYTFKPFDADWNEDYNILFCLFAGCFLLIIVLLFGTISNVTQSALRIKFPAEQPLEEE